MPAIEEHGISVTSVPVRVMASRSATSLMRCSIALAAFVTSLMPYAESFGVVQPNRQTSCLTCVKELIKRDGCDLLAANSTTAEFMYLTNNGICIHCGQTAMTACAQDACRKVSLDC